MKKTFLISIITIVLFSFVMIQCTKEKTIESTSGNLELRDGSDCNPQDLYTDFTECTFHKDTRTISFSNRPQLYSQQSYLFQTCPNLQVEVTFFETICKDSSGHDVTLISGMTYDMEALLNDCPQLRYDIRYDYYLKGSVVDILDLIDNEISLQLEYEIAWEDIEDYHIECPNESYFIKYIKNTCYKWELVGVLCDIDSDCFVWAKVDCGSSVCCARSNSYCGLYDDVTGLYGIVKITPTEYQTFEGNCDAGCTHDCQ